MGRWKEEWLVHSVTLMQVTQWEEIRARIFIIEFSCSIGILIRKLSLLLICYLHPFTFKCFSNKSTGYHFHWRLLLWGFLLKPSQAFGYFVYTFSYIFLLLLIFETHGSQTHLIVFSPPSLERWEFDSMTEFKMHIEQQVVSWVSL